MKNTVMKNNGDMLTTMEGEYLKEVGKISRLSVEQEEALGWRIFEGRKAKELLVGEQDADKRQKYRELIKDGVCAQKELVNANLRLVVPYARHLMAVDFEFMDLVQEGNIGLMKAAEKYDVTKGYRFSTYAVWWIKQAIFRALNSNVGQVHIPEYVRIKMNQVKKARVSLYAQLGRQATTEELAQSLQMPEDAIMELDTYVYAVSSIDETIGEEDKLSIGDILADTTMQCPEQYMDQRALQDVIAEVLGQLSEKEAYVLSLRAGLGRERACTLEEIGQMCGVTRERIRQIETRAIKKILRSSELRKKLLDFYQPGRVA